MPTLQDYKRDYEKIKASLDNPHASEETKRLLKIALGNVEKLIKEEEGKKLEQQKPEPETKIKEEKRNKPKKEEKRKLSDKEKEKLRKDCAELLKQAEKENKQSEKRRKERSYKGLPAELTPSEVVKKAEKSVSKKIHKAENAGKEISKREVTVSKTSLISMIKTFVHSLASLKEKRDFLQKMIVEMKKEYQHLSKARKAEYGMELMPKDTRNFIVLVNGFKEDEIVKEKGDKNISQLREDILKEQLEKYPEAGSVEVIFSGY